MRPTATDMAKHFRMFMAAFALVALAVIGCADFGSGILSDDDGGDDTATVFFGTQILPIFQANCGGSFCHNPCGNNNGGGLCLVSYATLSASGVVISRDAENSALVQRLDGRQIPRMPYGRLPLNDSLILRIRTWIDEGALDN